ncbi:hypothetical protein ACIPQA_13765 [Streptomyces sp. NPDC090109]|uniref:hypothetical protein n=1 Tax=unclassified Streptomyces TaxID=2593676 RepID=UPI001368A30E|nr:hypothetical protein [Streptomyces sp. SID5770]MZE54424.1 hypothetical protein [Streptomyces sp. SID5770]
MNETPRPGDPNGIQVGDIYEDCSFHPVLCTAVDDVAGVVLSGISLIDGSFPRSCDALYCGPIHIRVEEVVAIKQDLDGYARRRKAELRADDTT